MNGKRARSIRKITGNSVTGYEEVRRTRRIVNPPAAMVGTVKPVQTVTTQMKRNSSRVAYKVAKRWANQQQRSAHA